MKVHQLPMREVPALGPFDAERRPLRLLAAAMLRGAGRVLDGLAQRLSVPPVYPNDVISVEFHAEAGAPEGALYVNGQLVGHLPGVRRL